MKVKALHSPTQTQSPPSGCFPRRLGVQWNGWGGKEDGHTRCVAPPAANPLQEFRGARRLHRGGRCCVKRHRAGRWWACWAYSHRISAFRRIVFFLITSRLVCFLPPPSCSQSGSCLECGQFRSLEEPSHWFKPSHWFSRFNSHPFLWLVLTSLLPSRQKSPFLFHASTCFWYMYRGAWGSLWHLSVRRPIPPSLQSPWGLCIFGSAGSGHSGGSIIVKIIKWTYDFSTLYFFPSFPSWLLG